MRNPLAPLAVIATIAIAAHVDAASAQLLPPLLPKTPAAGLREGSLDRQINAVDSLVTDLRNRARDLRSQASVIGRIGTNRDEVIKALRAEATRRVADAVRLETLVTQRNGQVTENENRLLRARERLPALTNNVIALRNRVESIPAPTDPSSDPYATDRVTAKEELERAIREEAATQAEITDVENRIAELGTEIANLQQTVSTTRSEADQRNSAAAKLETNDDAAAVTGIVAEAGEIEADATLQEAQKKKLETQLAALNIIGNRFILPVRSRSDAQAFFDQRSTVRFAENANISLGARPGVGTASLEYASGFLGPLRFAVTGIVSRVEDDTLSNEKARIESARHRFFAGGGGTVLSTALPLLYIDNRYFTVVGQGLGRWSFDTSPLAIFDKSASEIPMVGQLGADGYISIGSPDLRLFALGQFSRVLTSNRLFREIIGHTESSFAHFEGAAGIEFTNGFRLMGTWVDAPGDMKREVRFSIQLSPFDVGGEKKGER